MNRTETALQWRTMTFQFALYTLVSLAGGIIAYKAMPAPAAYVASVIAAAIVGVGVWCTIHCWSWYKRLSAK